MERRRVNNELSCANLKNVRQEEQTSIPFYFNTLPCSRIHIYRLQQRRCLGRRTCMGLWNAGVAPRASKEAEVEDEND